MGEAAGYGIGLIMAGRLDQPTLDELLKTCSENTHEKTVRGAALACAMMAFRQEEQAEVLIDQLMASNDHTVRYGGALAIGQAYAGSGNNKALQRLLGLAASDVSDDVRRAAVISIGFVMCHKPEAVHKMIGLVSINFNPHVRYGAAIALGVACAGSNHPEAIRILQTLMDDTSDTVKQGAILGLALVMMQATKNHQSHVEGFREKLWERVVKKGEDPITKMVSTLALGILEAGGRNAMVKLVSQSGDVKRRAVMGVLLFVQYWYWFPLIQCLSMSLEPCHLTGVNTDLKLPKGFSFISDAKRSVFDYPPIVKHDDKKDDKKTQKITLSTTRRVQARQAQKKSDKKMETEKLPEQQEPEHKEETKEEEEPQTELKNPSRVLPLQERKVKFDLENRYQPVMPGRTRGYLFLVDSQKGEFEEYVDDEPLEAWLIPPPDFVFDAAAQEENQMTE